MVCALRHSNKVSVNSAILPQLLNDLYVSRQNIRYLLITYQCLVTWLDEDRVSNLRLVEKTSMISTTKVYLSAISIILAQPLRNLRLEILRQLIKVQTEIRHLRTIIIENRIGLPNCEISFLAFAVFHSLL